MTEQFTAGYSAGYAAALRKVRDALHEGFVRPHTGSPGCVLVPDGTRAERLLCRLYWLTEPQQPASSKTVPEIEVVTCPALPDGAWQLRLLRGGKS